MFSKRNTMIRVAVLIPAFALILQLNSLSAGNSDVSFNHEVSAGYDRNNAIVHYRYSFNPAWHLRSGLFTNLEPGIFSYHLNAGGEYHFVRAGDRPQFYAGIDLVMLNFYDDGDPIFGAGPVAGIRYNVTDRFSVSLEQGAAGYMREFASVSEFRWTWHRHMALMLGWKFSRKR